jgi:site-specific recombinase XerD
MHKTLCIQVVMQARALLERPDESTLKGKCDRAILVTLRYHGIRREELTTLKVRDLHACKGVPHHHAG